jgi:nucleoside-triphosphatase THEP1
MSLSFSPSSPMTIPGTHPPLPLAALVHPDERHDLEALLEQTARSLQAQGWRVAGLVHRHGRYPNGNKRMLLADLCNADTFELSQDLGAASQACSLNPQALAQASAVLRQALAQGVDLLVINRFGAVEATGRGFAAEFAAAVEAGVPVLTAVAERHVADWERFTGGAHATLPPDKAALAQWCAQQRRRVRAA